MMSTGQVYLTAEGLSKLKAELIELKTVKRKDISQRIQEAKELGDLSENAEYAEAKNEQGFIEGRIVEIENILKNVEVIHETNKSDEMIQVGSTITVRSNGTEQQYTIVGSNEANPTKGYISNESPLGQAFLGQKIGSKIEIKVPKGLVNFEIIKIS